MINKEIPADFMKWLNNHVEQQRPEGMQEWDFALEVGKEVYRHLSLVSKPAIGLRWVRAALDNLPTGEVPIRYLTRVPGNWYDGADAGKIKRMLSDPDHYKDIFYLDESIPSAEHRIINSIHCDCPKCGEKYDITPAPGTVIEGQPGSAEPAKEERFVVTIAEIKEIYADAVREFITIPGGDDELTDQINESFAEFIDGWKLKNNAGREG